jgi:putative FmdB family regulatory protein
MAMYEYRCRTCEARFELRRPMADADAPAPCPQGHQDAVRLLSVFASVGAASTGGASRSAETPPGPCGGACACYPS